MADKYWTSYCGGKRNAAEQSDAMSFLIFGSASCYVGPFSHSHFLQLLAWLGLTKLGVNDAVRLLVVVGLSILLACLGVWLLVRWLRD
jgi:hypothetical protein